MIAQARKEREQSRGREHDDSREHGAEAERRERLGSAARRDRRQHRDVITSGMTRHQQGSRSRGRRPA